ncbi:hypothetical protein IH992_30585, partial [Candidatus Poribacteria bacterium]|nr:hypothetical protein [Candidatus Poribacteria bacterium]
MQFQTVVHLNMLLGGELPKPYDRHSRHRLGAAVLLMILLVPCAWASSQEDNEKKVSSWFNEHRESPALRAFVQRMPKGGDIHTHLSGAVYAERYLEWAESLDYCVDTEELKITDCKDIDKDHVITVKDLSKDSARYNKFIDALSIRNLAHLNEPGLSQFFATFSRFGSISWQRQDDMLADVANRAANQHTSYLEIMLTFQGEAVRELVRKLGRQLVWDNKAYGQDEKKYLNTLREKLLDYGLLDLVKQGQLDVKWLIHDYRKILNCGTAGKLGCDVTIRFLQQTTRVNAPERVFAQLVYAFELAKAEPHVVGINLVSPEDNRIALRDYTLHMEMIKFLHGPTLGRTNVNIALHAGELTLGLIPPQELRFHINDAVNVARAKRIGHGVDIFYEDNPFKLMKTMMKKEGERGVLVEICLTSNDVILEVKDEEHPFQSYWEHNVPVTLATDNQGISRIDLSNEYLRAVRSYDFLKYKDLKWLARNSLEYSFLPGKSLWKNYTWTKKTDTYYENADKYENAYKYVVVDDCSDDYKNNVVSPTGKCGDFLKSKRA